VLICWHHGKIPELAAKLGADVPKHFKDTVFDRVWRIDYDKMGKVRFHDLPQQLLAGGFGEVGRYFSGRWSARCGRCRIRSRYG